MDPNLAHLVGIISDIKNAHATRFAFPSKVGGRPAWLRPDSIPSIECESCARSMTFLLQIYAPVAEFEGAFHRSLLVFTCLHCRCFIRAFRTQLPLINEFYGTESLGDDRIPEIDPLLSKVCCEECGMAKHNDGSMCRALPEYGLDIEELDEIDMDDEDDEDDDDEDMSSDDEMAEEEKKKMADFIKSSPGMDLDESETDVFGDFADTSIEKDKTFRLFKKFVQETPSDQVIYYSLGGHPLWITEQNQLPGSPPNCEHCKGPRQFEFQIQPQLIYHIMKRLRGFPMSAAPFEWGVVAIYTCVSNCGTNNGYMEEFTFNQLEPAEWLDFNVRKKIDFSKPKSSSSPVIAEDEDDGEWQ